MRTVQEIESANERMEDDELRQLSVWFDEFLALETMGQSKGISNGAFAKWAGCGQLPVGMNTDDYLRLIRKELA